VKAIKSAHKESLRVGQPASPDPDMMTKGELDERRKTVERLQDLTRGWRRARMGETCLMKCSKRMGKKAEKHSIKTSLMAQVFPK
jgi:hypothetical protein